MQAAIGLRCCSNLTTTGSERGRSLPCTRNQKVKNGPIVLPATTFIRFVSFRAATIKLRQCPLHFAIGHSGSSFIRMKAIRARTCTYMFETAMARRSFGFIRRSVWRIVMVSMPAHCENCGISLQKTGRRSRRHGMSTSPKSVRFDDDTMWVGLTDGRTIAVPLTWFPRLLDATPEQRALVELSKSGLHWEALDEDISVAGLLAGQPDLSRRGSGLAV